MTLTDSKGEGQVKVMDVSSETGHFSSDLRNTFPKIIKELGYVDTRRHNHISIKESRYLIYSFSLA